MIVNSHSGYHVRRRNKRGGKEVDGDDEVVGEDGLAEGLICTDVAEAL